MPAIQTSPIVILGIDPGTTVTGYGVVQVSGRSLTALAWGVLQLGKLPSDDHPEKLKRIYLRVAELAATWQPQFMAIETPFTGKNPDSTIKLGRAQGVAIAAAAIAGLEVVEYSPRSIKQAVTGRGNASKEQVSAMALRSLQGVDAAAIAALPPDVTDALAAAITLALRLQNPLAAGGTGGTGTGKKGSADGWDSFLKQNPDRLKR